MIINPLKAARSWKAAPCLLLLMTPDVEAVEHCWLLQNSPEFCVKRGDWQGRRDICDKNKTPQTGAACFAQRRGAALTGSCWGSSCSHRSRRRSYARLRCLWWIINDSHPALYPVSPAQDADLWTGSCSLQSLTKTSDHNGRIPHVPTENWDVYWMFLVDLWESLCLNHATEFVLLGLRFFYLIGSLVKYT